MVERVVFDQRAPFAEHQLDFFGEDVKVTLLRAGLPDGDRLVMEEGDLRQVDVSQSLVVELEAEVDVIESYPEDRVETLDRVDFFLETITLAAVTAVKSRAPPMYSCWVGSCGGWSMKAGK